MRRLAALAALHLLCAVPAAGQQVEDSAYAPAIPRPTFTTASAPLVLIDEAHHNFHTVNGRFYPFAHLLRRDGYRVQGSDRPFTVRALAGARVLVISNALAARNAEEWSLPTPSAFTAAEIDAVSSWVQQGGSLLLIADHMPFAGAAAALARRLGFDFSNGFALHPDGPQGPFVFRTSDGSLRLDALGAARRPGERIDSIATFTGSAFRAAAEGVQPMLVLAADVVSLEPDTAWVFTDATRRVPVAGWLQGGVRDYGRGRVAVFGEAAMFTAQLAGVQRSPMGMNHPLAAGNHTLVLQLLRWLAHGE